MTTIQENLKKLEQEMRGNYLTEKYLGDILHVVYPDKIWNHDTRFQPPGSATSLRYKPDYCCHELKMCVEFDGPDHYTKATVIQADNKKDTILKGRGYSIIRIPYFVQLNTFTLKYFFGIDAEFDYGFKHGFIEKGVILPGNFCEQGVWKFDNFITRIKNTEIFTDIKESLIEKINNAKLPHDAAMLTALPSSLLLTFGLLKFDHESLDNHYKIKSTLGTNWNCVILEGSQTVQSIPGVFDMRYSYNSKGNICSISFKFFSNLKIYNYLLLIDCCEGEGFVNIKAYVDNELSQQKTFETSKINLFNVHDLIFGSISHN